MKIRHTFLLTLLPPVVMMALLLGGLNWRSAIETQRAVDALQRDTDEAIPHAVRLQQALSSLNRALVGDVLTSNGEARDAQRLRAREETLWRAYQHYVATLTLARRPNVVRLLQEANALEHYHARETTALAHFARDGAAMKREIARLAGTVQRGDMESARAQYTRSILPLVNSMQVELEVLELLQIEHGAYALQRFETMHRRSARWFAGVTAAGTILFFVLALVLARRFTRPIAALTRAVEHAPEAASIQPVALRASGEIGQLAKAFQDMRTRLAAQTLESQRNQRLLQETASSLDEAQRVSGVGSWTYDLHTHRVTWSDEHYRLFGVSPGEFEPSYEAFVAAVHPDDRARVVEIIKGTIETSSSFAYDYRVSRNGETRILHARGQVGDGPTRKASVLAGTSQDVTVLREAEAASKISIERFELAARATHDSLWDWDIVNDRLWRNKAFYDTFRYGSADPGMVPCRTALIHPDDAPRVEKSLQGFLASDREGWACEYRFRRADAGYVWILDRGFVVRDASGAPTRMIGSMMNVTARKEADRMTSDFVAFASHQLRTPLTGINWMLELALDVPDVPPAARKHIMDAEASGQRLVSLVNDLLDVARLESSELPMTREPVQLAPLTRTVIGELRQSFADKRHLVVLNLNGGGAVNADVLLLRQVIMNLLANAIIYTPSGKTITVAMTSHHGAVRWSVTDSGIGVPNEAKSRLFEKFFRAGNAITLIPEGTGLGLHLVRLIIQQSGGSVWCDSEGEGKGATFTFEMPSVEAA